MNTCDFGTFFGRFLRRKMVIFVSLCSCGFQNSKKCHGRSQKDAKLGALGTQNSQFRALFRPAGPLFGAPGSKRSYFGSPIHCERVNVEFFYGNCIFFAFYTWQCYAEAAAAPAFFRSRSTIARGSTHVQPFAL